MIEEYSPVHNVTNISSQPLFQIKEKNVNVDSVVVKSNVELKTKLLTHIKNIYQSSDEKYCADFEKLKESKVFPCALNYDQAIFNLLNNNEILGCEYDELHSLSNNGRLSFHNIHADVFTGLTLGTYDSLKCIESVIFYLHVRIPKNEDHIAYYNFDTYMGDIIWYNLYSVNNGINMYTEYLPIKIFNECLQNHISYPIFSIGNNYWGHSVEINYKNEEYKNVPTHKYNNIVKIHKLILEPNTKNYIAKNYNYMKI